MAYRFTVDDYYPRASWGREEPGDLIKKEAEWRGLFDPKVLERAQKKTVQAEASRYENYGRRCYARFRSGRRYGCEAQITRRPEGLEDTWEKVPMSCNCEEGRQGKKCVHLAAILFAWEAREGPFFVRETPLEYRQRKEREEREAVLAAREERKKKYGMEPVPALEAFKDLKRPEGLVFFDVEGALADCLTTPYAIACLKDAEDSYKRTGGEIQIESDREGARWLELDFHFSDSAGNVRVEGFLEGNEILSLDVAFSESRHYWPSIQTPVEDRTFDPRALLDPYQLFALRMAWAYMLEDQKGGDQTDDAARTFFKEMEKAARKEMAEEALPQEDRAAEKRAVLELMPRISIEDGEARLSFKLGKTGSRLFVVRNLEELTAAYRHEEKYFITKKESFDFKQLDMREEFLPLMRFITRRVGEVRGMNNALASRNLGHRTPTLSVRSFLEMKGSLLDGFYDAAEGKSCEYQDKTNDVKESMIPIGHRRLKIQLTAERLSDARDAFAGVTVSGLIPVLIQGSSSSYVLNAGGLSRISKKEKQILAPFRRVADASGYFRFAVGRDNLQEFYYRVLPSLLDNPHVFLDDRTGGEADRYLPPEPEFTFYLDRDEGKLLCGAEVAYDQRTYPLRIEGKRKQTEQQNQEGYRDRVQEERVLQTIASWFPEYDPYAGRFTQSGGEDAVFDFLTRGMAQLEHYGTCKGTEAFRRCGVRPVPSVQMGISLDTGLMDISVTSREADPEELLAILDSYRQKKRYHRMRSGDFIDLAQTGELAEVEQVLRGLDLAPEAVLGKKVSLPAYRALYLDQLLSDHEAVASSRSRTYRTLIRNFRSIRDADYELPGSLEDVLRPYQSYGYKWLRTLEGAGFGGILADEMGLGKTLQMIAVLQAFKEDRKTGESGRLALVVCPASLVYNWEEEIRRFAPSLSCQVLAGTLGARKKVLAAMDTEGSDVYVTSYDTLKRDILLYKDRTFSHCVLDEAQFIKNPKAAVTKAVKAIRADHRFALTGTPIENRLSELWSIFDFLMPGFLYGAADFSRRFEIPIMKEKEEQATERLKKMTGPFILRRRKEEVLKDLPAKLEEVRYARLAGEQQKIYDAQVIRMKRMLAGAGKGPAGEEKIRIFAELTRIRQICCDPSLILEDYRGESAKRTAVTELISSAIDGGHRMLVFSQFTSMLALLEEDLKKEGIPYYTITGATPKERRLALVHDFNEGDVPVFLISLKAGGTGLNLTGADMVIHYDPWWNLAVQNQATDRAHRIGQTRQVTVYRLVLKDTIEEKILALQEEKKDLAEAILAGERDSIMSLSNEELLDLLS